MGEELATDEVACPGDPAGVDPSDPVIPLDPEATEIPVPDGGDDS